MRSFYGRTGISVQDVVEDKFSLLAHVVPIAAERAAIAGAEVIQERAFDLCPVSKGVIGNGTDGSHMRDNIRVELIPQAGDTASARIFVPLSIHPYAPHQEFGANGTPFLRPAIDETRDEVKRTMAETFRAELQAGAGVVGVSTKQSVRFRRFA